MLKLLTLLFCSLLLGGIIGYGFGVYNTINWVAEKATHFIDLDQEAIAHVLLTYKHRIDIEFPLIQNASIFNDTWNQA